MLNKFEHNLLGLLEKNQKYNLDSLISEYDLPETGKRVLKNHGLLIEWAHSNYNIEVRRRMAEKKGIHLLKGLMVVGGLGALGGAGIHAVMYLFGSDTDFSSHVQTGFVSGVFTEAILGFGRSVQQRVLQYNVSQKYIPEMHKSYDRTSKELESLLK